MGQPRRACAGASKGATCRNILTAAMPPPENLSSSRHGGSVDAPRTTAVSMTSPLIFCRSSDGPRRTDLWVWLPARAGGRRFSWRFLRPSRLSQLDQPSIGGTETACIEVETLQVIVEVNMKPLAPCSLRVLRGNGEETFPDALSAGTMCHQSVFDKRVHLTVPDHVDEADEALIVSRRDPPQAEAARAGQSNRFQRTRDRSPPRAAG